jgi:hypothetical protein
MTPIPDLGWMLNRAWYEARDAVAPEGTIMKSYEHGESRIPSQGLSSLDRQTLRANSDAVKSLPANGLVHIAHHTS